MAVLLMILATLRREVNQFRQSRARVVAASAVTSATDGEPDVSDALAQQGILRCAAREGRSGKMARDLERSGPFFGVGGMAVSLFLYAYSAIALPSWLHTVLMPLLWLGLFVLACRWFTRRPKAVVVVPLLAVVAWFALVLGFGAGA